MCGAGRGRRWRGYSRDHLPHILGIEACLGAGVGGLAQGHFSKLPARLEFLKDLAVSLINKALPQIFRLLPWQQRRDDTFGRVEPAPKQVTDAPVPVQERPEMRYGQ